MKTSLLLDDTLWYAFRKACLDHRVSATSEIERLIKNRVSEWEDHDYRILLETRQNRRTPKKET